MRFNLSIDFYTFCTLLDIKFCHPSTGIDLWASCKTDNNLPISCFMQDEVHISVHLCMIIIDNGHTYIYISSLVLIKCGRTVLFLLMECTDYCIQSVVYPWKGRGDRRDGNINSSSQSVLISSPWLEGSPHPPLHSSSLSIDESQLN